MKDTIAARRRHIEQTAPCVGCGATREACEANRGKDPMAPPWFGCCARGTGMDPCQHVADPAAMRALLDEIEAGEVRTVEQVTAPERARAEGIAAERADRKAKGVPLSAAMNKFGQAEWWRTRGEGWIRVADMSPTHRANTADYLRRNAAAFADRQAFVELGLFRDATDDVVSSWLDDVERRDVDPLAWVMSTPLYRALTA